MLFRSVDGGAEPPPADHDARVGGGLFESTAEIGDRSGRCRGRRSGHEETAGREESDDTTQRQVCAHRIMLLGRRGHYKEIPAKGGRFGSINARGMGARWEGRVDSWRSTAGRWSEGRAESGAAAKLVYPCGTVGADGERATGPARGAMGNKGCSMFEFRRTGKVGGVPQHETGGLVDNCFDGFAG